MKLILAKYEMHMISFIQTDSSDNDFKQLVKALDADLVIRDGDEHGFYDQFNKIDMIKHVVVAYEDGVAVGCGAIKQYSNGVMEVKRMYVPPSLRGKGIASKILMQLEAWAKQLGYEKCILETGKQQPEAIALYNKTGYTVIENYGQYAGVPNSVCFEKIL